MIKGPALLLLSALALAVRAGGADPIRTTFREVDTILANPGQGWMGGRHFTSTVSYLRFNWAEAEPQPGVYDWSRIDAFIARAQSNGAAAAFRVMTCNAHNSGYYASPKWLFDEGCKGFEYVVGGDDPTSGGKRIPRIEPDYTDPVYRKRHAAFLAAWGRRYDGRPDVAFLDIGSYGVWGEWHTKHPAPVEVRRGIVDWYLEAFPRTPKVFMTDDAEVLAYALPRGVGLRRDGVGSPWHEQNWIGSKKYAGVPGMADAWKHAPVVFEWFGNHDYLKSRGWSFDAAVDFMLTNHVTLINDNIGNVPAEAMPQLEKLARRTGARFVLREVAHAGRISPGGVLNVRMQWSNTGVGKLYRPYVPRLRLLDAAHRVVASADLGVDAQTWLPGGHAIDGRLPVPADVPPGPCTLTVALVDPAGQCPVFRLAFDAPERYGHREVGRVVIE